MALTVLTVATSAALAQRVSSILSGWGGDDRGAGRTDLWATAWNAYQQGRLVRNSYLEALIELGPVGLALLLFVIAFTAWMLVRVFQRARAFRDNKIRMVAAMLLLALVSVAISIGFLSIALNKPLWIIVGLAIALERMTASRAEEAEREQRAGPA